MSLVIFADYALKVLEFFFLSLKVSFFSVKIVMLLVLHVSVEKDLTVFQNVLLSVASFKFRFTNNVF